MFAIDFHSYIRVAQAAIEGLIPIILNNEFMDCMLYLVMACGPFCWKKTVVSINLFVFSLVYLLPIIL